MIVMMKSRFLGTVGVVALLGGIVGVLEAQTPVTPAFEVASVKPNKSGDGPTMAGMQPGGRVTMINSPLRVLIRNAYQLQDFQIAGAPTWINTERFDVVAKAPGDLPPPRPGIVGPAQFMMRSLLADRFKLVVHLETRELPIYAIEMARSDGTLGPQLHGSNVDCAAITAARGRSGEPPAEPSGADHLQCGYRASGGRASGGEIMAGGVPLALLVSTLSQMVQQIVVDKTGLTGNFDYELKWTPDQVPPQVGTPQLPTIDSQGPSIFTALQEQLGLRFQSQKGPAQVLVIDHVEHPTEN